MLVKGHVAVQQGDMAVASSLGAPGPGSRTRQGKETKRRTEEGRRGGEATHKD